MKTGFRLIGKPDPNSQWKPRFRSSLPNRASMTSERMLGTPSVEKCLPRLRSGSVSEIPLQWLDMKSSCPNLRPAKFKKVLAWEPHLGYAVWTDRKGTLLSIWRWYSNRRHNLRPSPCPFVHRSISRWNCCMWHQRSPVWSTRWIQVSNLPSLWWFDTHSRALLSPNATPNGMHGSEWMWLGWIPIQNHELVGMGSVDSRT